MTRKMIKSALVFLIIAIFALSGSALAEQAESETTAVLETDVNVGAGTVLKTEAETGGSVSDSESIAETGSAPEIGTDQQESSVLHEAASEFGDASNPEVAVIIIELENSETDKQSASSVVSTPALGADETVSNTETTDGAEINDTETDALNLDSSQMDVASPFDELFEDDWFISDSDSDYEEPEKPGMYVVGIGQLMLLPDIYSEVLKELPEGTELTFVWKEGEWYKVEVGGIRAYIHSSQVRIVEPEDNGIKRRVRISSGRKPVMQSGQEVTMRSKLEGFENCSEIRFQWEVNKGNEYVPIEGANGPTYTYKATAETLGWGWRLVVKSR